MNDNKAAEFHLKLSKQDLLLISKWSKLYTNKTDKVEDLVDASKLFSKINIQCGFRPTNDSKSTDYTS